MKLRAVRTSTFSFVVKKSMPSDEVDRILFGGNDENDQFTAKSKIVPLRGDKASQPVHKVGWKLP